MRIPMRIQQIPNQQMEIPLISTAHPIPAVLDGRPQPSAVHSQHFAGNAPAPPPPPMNPMEAHAPPALTLAPPTPPTFHPLPYPSPYHPPYPPHPTPTPTLPPIP